MTSAFITPAVITWARNRSHLTQGEIAKRVNVSEPLLSAWEKGDAYPTLRQAEKLAKRLHVPFGYLFLSSPPTLELPLPDLRTVQGRPLSEPSPEFYDVLSDALRKQEWYRSHLEYEGAKPLPFVRRFSLTVSVRMIASDIHDTLAISREIRPQSMNWEVFLQGLMRKAEQIGILVLRNSVVGNNTSRPLSAQEFRGFVISDDIAPLVFLNGNDAKSAQIFTLVHELVHLWIGESGISNPDYRRRAEEHENPIERLCDGVAAEVLVPQGEFLSAWNQRQPIEQNLEFLTRYFKVSRVVILRRAEALDKISREEFLEYYSNRTLGNGATSQGGGDFYRNLLVRNSQLFTTALVEAVLNRRTSEREAARLLNVQVATFDRLTSWITGDS